MLGAKPCAILRNKSKKRECGAVKALFCKFAAVSTNVFVKPDEQSQTCLSFAMARKRTFKNVFVKPKDPRELAHLGLARNRTFKNKLLHFLLPIVAS